MFKSLSNFRPLYLRDLSSTYEAKDQDDSWSSSYKALQNVFEKKRNLDLFIVVDRQITDPTVDHSLLYPSIITCLRIRANFVFLLKHT